MVPGRATHQTELAKEEGSQVAGTCVATMELAVPVMTCCRHAVQHRVNETSEER